MLTRRKTVLAAIAGSVILLGASPASAWGWWPKPKPKPNPGSSSGGATQVPEPEMLVLFGLGTAGLVVARRKKRG